MYREPVRFLLGFLVASVLWGSGLAFLSHRGQLVFVTDSENESAAASAEPGVDEEASARDEKHGKPKRKKVRRPRLATAGSPLSRAREGQVGDDVGWDDARQVDMGAGEEQLSGSEIEAGFDSAMGRIRRCLILVPGDGEITGKLVFNMRVGGDGRPRAVQLTGPSAVTNSEAGACLRETAQGIRFATFDGPDMLFKFPVTLH